MSEVNQDFHFLINNLFYDYTENTELANYYIKAINDLGVTNSLEEFYKKYILNLIYINTEEYEIVLKNARECISLYNKINQIDQDNYRSEYLFSRYYDIFLTEYFDKNDVIDNKLLSLKQDILIQEENPLLEDLLTKINLYLLTFSKDLNQVVLFDNIKDFNIEDFSFFCEKTASQIIGQNDMNITDCVSHYTSINNSLNILEHKELWVTRYDFLNDKSEFKYINDVLKEIISDFMDNDYKQNLFNQEEKLFIQSLLELVVTIISYFHGEISYHSLDEREKHLVDTFKLKYYFVLSFSKNEDSLPLWGNYTEFTGINLVLNNKNMTDTFNNQKQEDYDLLYFINQNYQKNKENEYYSTFYFGEVLYDIKDIKNNLLKDFRKALDLHIKKPDVIQESVMARLLIEIILLRRLLVKKESFSYEEEYRFVFALSEELYNQKVEFRCGKYSFIPYIKIPINLDNLHKIVVGPKNYSDLVVKGFEDYLKHNNLSIKVKKSTIPLR